MKPHLLISLLLIVCHLQGGLLAQDVKTNQKSPEDITAIGVTDMVLIDQMMLTIPGGGGNSRELLQNQSVKSYMMPVRKLGFRGTELSYIMASCLEYYVNLNKNYKVNLSPDYISLNLKNSAKKASAKENFLFLVQKGTVSAAILPYDAGALTSAVYATQMFRINNYLHLFRDVTRSRQKIYEARKALMRGNPVVVELMASETLKAVSGERNWKPSKSGDKYFPLIVVGYDEGQEAFEVMSCWGSNWGINGYLWIRYEDFGKYAVNGFVIVPENGY